MRRSDTRPPGCGIVKRGRVPVAACGAAGGAALWLTTGAGATGALRGLWGVAAGLGLPGGGRGRLTPAGLARHGGVVGLRRRGARGRLPRPVIRRGAAVPACGRCFLL